MVNVKNEIGIPLYNVAFFEYDNSANVLTIHFDDEYYIDIPITIEVYNKFKSAICNKDVLFIISHEYVDFSDIKKLKDNKKDKENGEEKV